MKDEIILAIESSCDETAIAILKNNQELLEKFSNDRLKVILQYYLDENNKKRERLKKISN